MCYITSEIWYFVAAADCSLNCLSVDTALATSFIDYGPTRPYTFGRTKFFWR